MPFTITATTRTLTKQTKQQPMLILKIEGIEIIFGSSPIFEFLFWDEGQRWDTGLRWDATIEIENSRPYISLKGTTKSFSQQINVDRAGGTSSVSSIKISLVDKASEVSKLFSFDNITEILGRKATVYLSYADDVAVFPDDAIALLRGFIDDFSSSPGEVGISVTHPENLKRQSLFKRYTDELNGDINNTQTTITVRDTQNIIASQDALTTFIKIEEEIMEVISILNATQLQVIRGQQNTIAVSHDNESEVQSVYNISGDPIDLTLKLLLSDGDQQYFTSLEVINRFISNDVSLGLQNVIVFENPNIQVETGLIVGDQIIISGTSSNNGTYTIVDFGFIEDERKSFIQVSSNLVNESLVPNASWQYRSQYNIMNEGLGLLPDQVDIQGFLDTKDFYGVGFFNQNFFLTDTIDDAKTFIDTKILFPNGMYSVPRKAAVSVKYSAPPLSIETIPILNETNVTNISQVKAQRSTHKYYYNEILFNYNYNPLQEKLLDTLVAISNESKSRVKVGNKTLNIEASGADRTPSTKLVLGNTARRFLDRYRFAPKYYKGIKPLYKDTFNVEVGDIVAFGGSETKIVDLSTGERAGNVELLEVVDKNLNIQGDVTLDLLSTDFGIVGRFAVFSPASRVGSGSTTTKIILSKIFDQFDNDPQPLKYEELIGSQIRIYSEDYNYDETTTLIRLDDANENAVIVKALPSAPLQDYIFEIAKYKDQTGELAEIIKQKYSFTMSQATITSVTSLSVFTVNSSNDFFKNMLITVHSDDYNLNSQEVEIDSIAGNQITLKQALNITPQVGNKIEALGFEDALQKGYRFL